MRRFLPSHNHYLHHLITLLMPKKNLLVKKVTTMFKTHQMKLMKNKRIRLQEKIIRQKLQKNQCRFTLEKRRKLDHCFHLAHHRQMPLIQLLIKTLYQAIQCLTLMFLLHSVKALVHVSLGVPFKILYHIIICHLIFMLSLVSYHQNAYPHVSGALSHPRWKEAMIDEQALKRMVHGS